MRTFFRILQIIVIIASDISRHFFFFFNFYKQILIFVSLILSKNKNQSESLAYLHNKIFHSNTIRSEKAFVNLSMYILKNLEFEIIKNFFLFIFMIDDIWFSLSNCILTLLIKFFSFVIIYVHYKFVEKGTNFQI